VPNSFEENVCENANTLAHVVDHMVVLAHLRRRRSLSGREGLGPSLPPTELVSMGFRRFWGNEMPILNYAGSRKRNGGERRSQR
jgi:hypothetical protein